MSLTSELDRKDSPVSRFFTTHLDAQKTAAFFKQGRSTLRSWPLVAAAPSDAERQASVVGTAFDYVVRVVTWGLPLNETVAAHAVMDATGFQMVGLKDPLLDTRTGELYDFDDLEDIEIADPGFAQKRWLLERWRDMLEQWPSFRRDEGTLLPFLVVIAWIEGIRRSGRWAAPLVDAAQQGDDLDGVIHRVPGGVVEDIRNLLDLYRSTQLLQWADNHAVENPTFQGSPDVGGADADWIVGRTLWDMKTSKNPVNRFPSDVKQVLGYTLLDYDDRYGIERVGLYYPRFGKTMEWSAVELLQALTGVASPLPTWRQKWRSAVARE